MYSVGEFFLNPLHLFLGQTFSPQNDTALCYFSIWLRTLQGSSLHSYYIILFLFLFLILNYHSDIGIFFIHRSFHFTIPPSIIFHITHHVTPHTSMAQCSIIIIILCQAAFTTSYIHFYPQLLISTFHWSCWDPVLHWLIS